MLLGSLLSTAYVFKHFPRFPLKSFVKILVASWVIVIVSTALPTPRILLIAKYILLTAVFLVSLLLLGEIKKMDIKIIAAAIR
jgi:hypothetical protein